MVRQSDSGVRGSARLRDELTRAIEAAAVDELAENGYGRFSMAAVARRAGVGKAAIYRRWATQEAMLIDLLAPKAVLLAAGPASDTLAGDVRAFVEATRRAFAVPRVASIVADLFAEALRNPSLFRVLHEEVTVPRRAGAAEMLARATARGEIPSDVDLDAALDLLAGPSVVRMMTSTEPPSDAWVDSTVAMLLRALGYDARSA
ncbi:TetR/AcrR family transcriptional regulator [Cryptosporangium phraense]|uniref:TetR/AcrR family transcriptional regulator n=1 Tax=Cryptosporangium phraense TaxID=2593070 RepID=A0A545B2I2_9ACTN|nr:TetR/AcrR family transcriptional regulator [Cryptosporangium phraense]TQS47055.1 TetR/AcrR family transcriptional regulator [Cryptosporangium phraense]